VDAILAELKAAAPAGDELEIIGAAEGLVLEVTSSGKPARPTEAKPQEAPVPGATRIPVVKVVGKRPATNDPLYLGMIDEGLSILDEAQGEGGSGATRTAVGLVLVKADHLAPGKSLADAVRAATSGLESSPPVLVVSEHSKPGNLDLPKAVDWLKRPFSREFARARMRTALLRGQFRWVPAPVPPDELQRLAALQALGLLDTPAEERFDRLTRVAAALFDVPIALVSLVDANRQWFKSCVGTDIKESSREMSFCAHAVAARDMLVIPDALRDDRFADNPVVSGPPYVRFYAGAPIFTADGHCAGTLCIIDGRPRDFTDDDKDRLRDLAAIVQQELTASSYAMA
ncbi:MAG: GAF domain-containing protein, partial [Novosphingobium sp.]|nr:GAF domain-containing protein [Novosphingobium sp.]